MSLTYRAYMRRLYVFHVSFVHIVSHKHTGSISSLRAQSLRSVLHCIQVHVINCAKRMIIYLSNYEYFYKQFDHPFRNVTLVSDAYTFSWDFRERDFCDPRTLNNHNNNNNNDFGGILKMWTRQRGRLGLQLSRQQ